jgi:hypothetical protein
MPTSTHPHPKTYIHTHTRPRLHISTPTNTTHIYSHTQTSDQHTHCINVCTNAYIYTPTTRHIHTHARTFPRSPCIHYAQTPDTHIPTSTPTVTHEHAHMHTHVLAMKNTPRHLPKAPRCTEHQRESLWRRLHLSSSTRCWQVVVTQELLPAKVHWGQRH